MAVTTVRNMVSDALWRRSMNKHRSNMGWRQAPLYDRYLNRCRAAFDGDLPPLGSLVNAVDGFARDGVTSFCSAETVNLAEGIRRRIEARERSGVDPWRSRSSERDNDTYAGDLWHDFPEVHGLLRGPLATFLQHFYRCDLKYYFGLCYRSMRRTDLPTGSQLWHSDSGPGICVNVMVYLTDVGPDDGPLQVLPWPASLPIFLRQPGVMRKRLAAADEALDRLAQRDILCRYYAEAIDKGPAEQVRKITGPAGTVIPFFNNSLHRGGFPEAGHTRCAAVFHCYPSHRPTDWSVYDRDGLKKRGSYPSDPSEVF